MTDLLVARIDPELRAARTAVLEALGHDFMGAGSAPARRARFQTFLDALPSGDDPFPGIARRRHELVRDGAPAVPVLIFRPNDGEAVRPAILFIHGGAFSIGSAAQEAHGAASLAHRLGCVVVSVDYRLAPETRHPGAIDDCYHALRWMAADADALGIDPRRLAVHGHSAGGGLAAVVAQRAHEVGEVRLCFQLLCYPMLDDRLTGRSLTTRDGLGVFDTAAVRLGWDSLLGPDREARPLAPYGAAARKDAVAGLPPPFIDVGDLAGLLDENLDYARRLADAGVEIELHVYSGAYHGFDMFAPAAAVSMRATEAQIAAFRRAFDRAGAATG